MQTFFFKAIKFQTFAKFIVSWLYATLAHIIDLLLYE